MTYLDTHVLAWLYDSAAKRLGETGRIAIEETDELLASPMALLELDYLHEIGRLSVGSAAIFDYLHQHIGLAVCNRSFAAVASRAANLTWTRDPFDRLIVAQAALGDNVLITRDTTIAAHYPHVVW